MKRSPSIRKHLSGLFRPGNRRAGENMSASIPAHGSTLGTHRNLTRTTGVVNGRLQDRGATELPVTSQQKQETPTQPVNGGTPAENGSYAPAQRQNSLDDLLEAPSNDLKGGMRNVPPAPYSSETPPKRRIDLLA